MSPSVSNQVTTTWTGRDELSPTLKRIQGNTGSLERAFGSLRARFVSGFVMGAGERFFGFLEQTFHRLVDFLPNLVGKGQAWASTIDAITDSTQLSAQQASILASIYQDVNGNTEGLVGSLAMANKNLAQNTEFLQKNGITAKDVGGALDQLRHMYQETGATSQFAITAQKLLGRGWRDQIDVLGLTDEAWKQLTADAYASGRVLTEQQVRDAETWQRTWNRLQGTVTGVGAQILSGISPVLSGVVDSFTRFVQQHLTEIVTFLSQTITAVASFFASLLGINLNVQSLMGSITGVNTATDKTSVAYDRQVEKLNRMKEATKGTTSGTNGYVEALRRQLDALNKNDQAQRARQQLQQTLHDLAQARRDLRDTQNEAYLSADMSDVAIALAEQKHQADVRNARDNVKQAEDAVKKQREQMAIERQRNAIEAQIARYTAAQTAATNANTAAIARQQKLVDNFFQPQKGTKGGLLGGIVGDISKQLDDAKTFGKGIADAISNAIFGTPNTRAIFDNQGHITLTVERSGGLLTWLQNVAGALGGLGTFLSDNKTAILALIGALAVFRIVSGIGSLIGVLGGLPIAIAGAVAIALGAAWIQTLVDARKDVDAGNVHLPAGGQFGPRTSAQGQYFDSHGNSIGDPNSKLWGTVVKGIDSSLANYLGLGSPLDQANQQNAALLGALTQNTTALADGSLQVKMPDGTTITGWTADDLKTKVQNWVDTQKVTNPNLGNIGNVDQWNVNKALDTKSTSVFDYVKGTYNRLVSISAYTYWNGHGAATYLASINAVLQKKNPIIPAGKGAIAGGSGASSDGSGSQLISVQLDRRETRAFLRGERVVATMKAAS